MHRFRHQSDIMKLRFCSFAYVASLGLFVGFLGVSAHAYWQREPQHPLLAISLLLASIVMFLAQVLTAQDVYCPLCRGQLMLHRKCSKSPKARQLFGSYRLMIALSLWLRQQFRCSYCGETCKCAVSQPRHHQVNPPLLSAMRPPPKKTRRAS